MIKYIPLLFALGAQAEDVPFKNIDTTAEPYYVAGTAHVILGTVVMFDVFWEGKGTQRVIAGCNEYNYGLPDISTSMYTAEPDTEMFDIITQACDEVKQWI